MLATRTAALLDVPDVEIAPLIVREVEQVVAGLAHVGRPRAHLALLVDDRLIVGSGRRLQVEDGPAVLDREVGGHASEIEPRPELRSNG